MVTRTRKWAHYRARIKRLPENRFPRPVNELKQTHADEETVSNLVLPSAAIIYRSAPAVRRKKATPYKVYAKRKRSWLIVKIVSLLFMCGVFALVWFYWVK